MTCEWRTITSLSLSLSLSHTHTHIHTHKHTDTFSLHLSVSKIDKATEESIRIGKFARTLRFLLICVVAIFANSSRNSLNLISPPSSARLVPERAAFYPLHYLHLHLSSSFVLISSLDTALHFTSRVTALSSFSPPSPPSFLSMFSSPDSMIPVTPSDASSSASAAFARFAALSPPDSHLESPAQPSLQHHVLIKHLHRHKLKSMIWY